ncbi:hypothetical protein GUJ93_ZPchr0010g11004 [Zizania palustris]|uniref:Uncharacterized protein n=1 Tax=Zizania palustris TaxID=103762 RepID=A0A8J5TM56_ZIZPA|nr:hypothetical protein GUJ93_ZPchr0010g11004 [Zizania palustris]
MDKWVVEARATSSWQTPMDYDDTDFQSQNFHLAGEENSKFPPGFFFSVQGPSSSWIEVLSTGSIIVDFSSSAGESCSINRTSNVWSEATSTESVDMLLKSVGENEMTGIMDGNVHRQISSMDNQTDPSSMQPKSSNSPTDSIVVPVENDHSQSTCSEMMEDPSRIQPQLEHIIPFSVDGKDEQAVGSSLSDRNSNYMLESVAERCISGRSSSPKNTSESYPDVDSYFEVVHDDDSLDNLNIHSSGVDSRKLNNEPFSDLAPLQNIYSTHSYHFEQEDNQESGVGVTTQGSEVCHMIENKDGLRDLQNLSGMTQPLGTSNLISEVSNALLLESSDGLLEAITNPVKMLHKSDDTTKTTISTPQPSFLLVEHAAEDIKGSVGRSSESVVKKFGSSEEPDSAKSHQPELDSRNSNPHPVIPLPTKKDEFIQSPKGKQLAHVNGVPEETKADGMADVSISTSDESKHGMLEKHQDSVNNLCSCVMEENTTMEEIPALTGNIVHIVESGKKATASASATEDKLDSSGNIVSDNSPAGLLEEKDLSISFKEGATPALEDDPGYQRFVSPQSGHHKKKSTSLYISRNNIDSTAVTSTLNALRDKLDSSEGIAPNDFSAVLLDEKVSSMNHEGLLKEDDQSNLEVGDHNIASTVSEPLRKGSVGSVNTQTDAVPEIPQCEEHASSSGNLITNETQDKPGNYQDTCPQKFQSVGPLMQLEHHEDLVAPSSALVISSEKAEQKTGQTPLNGVDDLSVQLQGLGIIHAVPELWAALEATVEAAEEPVAEDPITNNSCYLSYIIIPNIT